MLLLLLLLLWSRRCTAYRLPPRSCVQRTHGGEGATNAAIAARPGLPVFTKALDLVQERDIDTDADVMKVGAHSPEAGRGSLQMPGPPITTTTTPNRKAFTVQQSHHAPPAPRPCAPPPLPQVIARTGPDLFTAALEAVGLQRTDGMFGAAYTLDGVGEVWEGGIERGREGDTATVVA